MEVKSIDVSGVFRTFTACATDLKTFLLDVRPHKQFHRSHVALSYNIRLSAEGKALLVSGTLPTQDVLYCVLAPCAFAPKLACP